MRDWERLDLDAVEVEGRAGVRNAQTGCWAPGDMAMSNHPLGRIPETSLALVDHPHPKSVTVVHWG